MTEQEFPPAHSVPAPREHRSARLIAALVVAFAGVTAFLLLTKRNTYEFTLDPRTSAERIEVAAKLRSDIVSQPDMPNTEREYWKADVWAIVLNLEEFTLEHDRLPRGLEELGYTPDSFPRRLRLVSGGDQWRLYGPGKEVLARGN